MKVGATAPAPRVGGNRVGEHVGAPRAPHHLMETGHIRRTPFQRLALGLVGPRLDAIGWGLRGLRCRGPTRSRPALARCILIAPLPILTIRHRAYFATLYSLQLHATWACPFHRATGVVRGVRLEPRPEPGEASDDSGRPDQYPARRRPAALAQWPRHHLHADDSRLEDQPAGRASLADQHGRNRSAEAHERAGGSTERAMVTRQLRDRLPLGRHPACDAGGWR